MIKNEENQLKSIFELIDSDQFRKRSAMYLGEKSISNLKLFMGGYGLCEFFNSIKSQDTRPPFNLFLQWICKYYQQIGSSRNWDEIILKNCENNQSKALDDFFERFDEFREHKPVRISICKLDKNGNKLYLVEYNKDFGYTLHHMNGEITMNSSYSYTIEEAREKMKIFYKQELMWNEVSKNSLETIYYMLNKNGL